jgi:hypothetical protein
MNFKKIERRMRQDPNFKYLIELFAFWNFGKFGDKKPTPDESLSPYEVFRINKSVERNYLGF